MEKQKKCSWCKKEKSLSEFHRDRSNPHGYRYECKACVKERWGTKENKRESMRKWRAKNPVRRLRGRRLKRIEAIRKLGGKCACCGENRIEFLSVDHINGLKVDRFRRPGQESGEGLIGQVRKENFPMDKYRILCHNCNLALGFYGYCPHQNPEMDFLTRPGY